MEYEILKLKERIDLALQLGESHFREFKSCFKGRNQQKATRNPKEICIDIAQTLVAFANADGGELLVGIEDDGTVSGVDYSEEKIGMLLDAPKTHIHKDTPLPTTSATCLKY